MTPPSVVRSAKPALAGAEAAALAALFLTAVAAAYAPALRGGLLWDDDAHVTKRALRSLHGLWRIWSEPGATQQYYPVLHSAFWIEHRLWGDSVLGYHLANVALHASSAWLLVLALRRLAFPAPVLAGLLFAMHPVCVESVAWIAEQKNTLSAAFYMASALAYLRFDETRSRGSYAGALALFVLALLTKSVTATLPAALLVVLWWRRGRVRWRIDVLPLVPWLLIGIAGGLVTAHFEVTLIGASGAGFALSRLQRLLLAGRAIAFYAGKALWPAGLNFVYPRWALDPADPSQYACLAGAVCLLAALVVLARRRRGPLAGYLFFVGTLFPVLGFVNVYPFIYSYVADHFQYLAILGILVPAAWGIDRLASRLRPGAALALAVPAILALLSWRQCRDYRDADTLNRATLARNPSAWRAHYDLGVSLGRDPARLDESIAEYEATLRLNPGYWAAHNNLGSAFMRIPGRTADAIAEYEAALRLNPDFADAHGNLSVALGRTPGRLDEAIWHAWQAVRLRPNDAGDLDNLGTLLMRQPGSLDEAIATLGGAASISPENPEYLYNLANALAEARRLPEAERQYREALRIKPDFVEAHSNLGAALDRDPGRRAEAVAEYRAAVRLAPGNAHLHENLANALAKAPASAPEAASEYEEALRIDPDDATAHNGLGIVLTDMPGRLPDAIRQFEAAIRLKPDLGLAHYCLAIAITRSGGSREEARAELQAAVNLQHELQPLVKRALVEIANARMRP